MTTPATTSPDDAHLDDRLTACQRRIGYVFARPQLIREALAHSSSRQETALTNDRLEFLGDAVLGLYAAARLFRAFPGKQEGPLTRMKGALVSGRTLGRRAEELGLAEFLVVDRGLAGRPQLPGTVLADALEAVVGAIYLDGGLAAAEAFCERILGPHVPATGDQRALGDYKSELQQLMQQDGGATPEYLVEEVTGPPHDRRFTVTAMVGSRACGTGTGRSKRSAEQAAARAALQRLAEEGETTDGED